MPLIVDLIRSLEMDRDIEQAGVQLQSQRQDMDGLQNQQAEDGRGISKQQKSTERYLAKRQMLLNRKDECNRSIRDLGVLPEEAFEKYTNERLDRVSSTITSISAFLTILLP